MWKQSEITNSNKMKEENVLFDRLSHENHWMLNKSMILKYGKLNSKERNVRIESIIRRVRYYVFNVNELFCSSWILLNENVFQWIWEIKSNWKDKHSFSANLNEENEWDSKIIVSVRAIMNSIDQIRLKENFRLNWAKNSM